MKIATTTAVLILLLSVTTAAWAPVLNHDYSWLTPPEDGIQQIAEAYKAGVEKLQAIRVEWEKKWEGYRLIPKAYREYVIKLNENKLDIPPKLIYYLVKMESWWYPTATGHNCNGTIDMGLMQLNSAYAWWFASVHYTGEEEFDPYNPYHNLEVGLKHLAWLGDYYNNNWIKALSAYNAGRGAVDNNWIPKRTVYYRETISKNAGLIKA
jgi:soluble lytic murein transglycosylase-like protein